MRDDGPLVFPLADILASAPGTERRYPLSAPPVDVADDLYVTAPIDGELRVNRTNRGVIVDVAFRTSINGTCSRCLADLTSPIRTTLREEVLPSLDLLTGAPIDAAAEPDVVRLDDHHRLDLEPLVRDAISLAEPIAPLCRPDCPGLCPDCGERLDGDHAAHEPDAIDPRLAALKGFAVEDDGSGRQG